MQLNDLKYLKLTKMDITRFAMNLLHSIPIKLAHPKISQYTFSSNKPSLQTHAQHYPCSCIKKIAGFI